MTNFLRTIADYEFFIYTLPEQFSSIKSSTLTLIRVGMSSAKISGEIRFVKDFILVVRERVLYNRLPVTIDEYGYEVWQGQNKLYWYDSQPHPNDPTLQNNHPHHKHIPPDIKHNRIPAPQMSFNQANLTVLIFEIENLSM